MRGDGVVAETGLQQRSDSLMGVLAVADGRTLFADRADETSPL